jgi:hypothetical protein
LDQFDELEELRVVPGSHGPAAREQQLLTRFEEIKYTFEALYFLKRDGKLPPGWEL